jgi:hypothetical protein
VKQPLDAIAVGRPALTVRDEDRDVVGDALADLLIESLNPVDVGFPPSNCTAIARRASSGSRAGCGASSDI